MIPKADETGIPGVILAIGMIILFAWLAYKLYKGTKK